MSACSLAAIAVLLAPPALDSPARIAVIVQGQQGEGAEAGRVQAEIEKELNLRQAAVKSAAELAQKLAMPAETPIPAPPLLLESANTKIAEAEAAFLRGEFDAAKAAAAEAKKLIATMPVESAFDERVLAALWHAAAVQQTDTKAAQIEVKEILYDVDPTPKVSVDVFPPDFIGFVETERQSLKTTSVRLTDVPAAAQIWINGRKADANPFTVVLQHPTARPNVVTVRAQGYRTAVFTLPPTPAQSIRLPLAPALPSEQEGAVRAAFNSKSDERVQRALTFLSDLPPPVTALVLVQTRGRAPPAVLLWKDKRFQPITAPNLAGVAEAVMDTFRKKNPEGLTVVTSAAVDVSLWTRELGGGDVYSLPLTGTGPRMSADIRWSSLLASTEVSYIRYLTPIEASVTGGGNAGDTLPTGGGSALRVSAGAGLQRTFGVVSAGFLLGGRFEQYSTKVLKVESTDGGGSEPIIGPHTWAGPQAQLRVGYTAGSIGITGGVGAVFASTYTEGEKNMSGADPVTGAAPFWRLGGTYAASEKLAVGLLYAGESRSTKFKGEPALEQQTPRSDLVLTDFLTTVALTAAYEF